MAFHGVFIEIEPDQVKFFDDKNWSLCFAFGVANKEGGEPNFNVVTLGLQPRSSMNVIWVENYGVAASESYFRHGYPLELASNVVNIKIGQTCFMPAKLWDETISTDPAAPANGFLLQKESDDTSAVVTMEVTARQLPIYISKAAPLSKGTETLIPTRHVTIWFDSLQRKGTMVSSFSTDPLTIDMTENKSRRAVVKYDGKWTIVSNS